MIIQLFDKALVFISQQSFVLSGISSHKIITHQATHYTNEFSIIKIKTGQKLPFWICANVNYNIVTKFCFLRREMWWLNNSQYMPNGDLMVGNWIARKAISVDWIPSDNYLVK